MCYGRFFLITALLFARSLPPIDPTCPPLLHVWQYSQILSGILPSIGEPKPPLLWVMAHYHVAGGNLHRQPYNTGHLQCLTHNRNKNLFSNVLSFLPIHTLGILLVSTKWVAANVREAVPNFDSYRRCRGSGCSEPITKRQFCDRCRKCLSRMLPTPPPL